MRIVFTHPYCWPYVRRGNERNMDEMARHFTAMGHEVTVLSSRPGPREVSHGDRGRQILASPIRIPGMGRLHVTTADTFYFRAREELAKLEADVVHSLLFPDALAASATAPRQGFATVFQMNGVALPKIGTRRFPSDAKLSARAIRRADACITCSAFIQGLVREHYDADSHVIPPMIDVNAFAGAANADNADGGGHARPTLLAAGDFTVRRKGFRVLIESFPLVKKQVPDALLQLSGYMPEALLAQLTRGMAQAVRDDIEVLGLRQPGDLPAQFANATALVLPAMAEPSGTVMMEAWAAGTPVVATRHGGIPEFASPETTVLFEPETDDIDTRNATGLADAIVAGFELARVPGTSTACQAHAQRFSCAATGPHIEALYQSIIS